MSLKKPSKRAWMRLLILGIFLLSLTALALDFPTVYNNYAKKASLKEIPHWDFVLGLDLQGGTHLVYEADMSEIPKADREESLSGVRDVIERRVNTFGVSEPLVQTNHTGDTYRIIVELAGITDVNEAINLIGETPLLEFKTQAEFEALTPDQMTEMSKFNEEAKKQAESVLNQLKKGEDFVRFVNEFSADTVSREDNGSLGWFPRGAMVPEFEEAVFALEKGEMTENLVQTQFGYHIILKEDERINEETGQEEVLASHILFETKSDADFAQLGGDHLGFESTGLGGAQLKSAQVSFHPQTGQPAVNLNFDNEGKDLFAQITQQHIGEIVAIYLDGSPISLPRVQQAITNGEAVITGMADLQEAKTLAQRLNAGALPVPIELMSQQTVGASLGQASLQQSLQAGLWGLLFVILFMILFYRIPGVLAVLALGSYAGLILLIFKLIPVTLTLAGIAGFILSIGMAVDANVLIFERMKENLREGMSLKAAIDDGFKRAWTSIRDGNVSTLITCFILIMFGTSFIQGFAVTLSIGVLLSMFTAVVITRTFLLFVSEYKWLAKIKLLGMKELE